jgi:hypothetical protein
MKHKILWLTIAMMLATAGTYAQVLIGGTGAPDSSALLDIRGTNKGILFPRINLTNTATWGLAGTISREGMIVYNTNASLAGTGANAKGFYYWNGTSWVWLAGLAARPWGITGNTGTDTAVNFIGTADNRALMFRINNTKSGMISQTNTALGYQALRLGGAPSPGTDTANTAIGANAMAANTTGNNNTAVGYGALNVNVSGSRNTAIGGLAMAKSKTGDANSILGYLALTNNISGSRNVGVGVNALWSDTSGSDNVGIGYAALNGNKNGNWNVAVGNNALIAATGSLNIGIGSNAGGDSVTTGSKNIVIGAATLTSTPVKLSAYTASYEMNIANVLFGTNIDSTIGVGKIGVNTRTPVATLHVNGSMALGLRVITTGSTYAIAADDYSIIASTGAALAITLPAAAQNKGRELVVRKSGTGGSTLTINAAAGDGIDESATPTSSVSGGSNYKLVSDGNVTWYRVD